MSMQDTLKFWQNLRKMKKEEFDKVKKDLEVFNQLFNDGKSVPEKKD